MHRMRTPRRVVSLIPTEDEEQEALFDWAADQPALSCMFAIPNGGFRNKATAVRMKRTGTKAGVPDIFLPIASHGFHGLFIEMKRTKGGSVSQAQRDTMERLTHEGYCCKVCKGFEEARIAIIDYLGGFDG